MNELVANIIAKEWAMFSAVQNQGGPADCQNDPRSFEIMRRSQLSTWSELVLVHYLNDLERASNEGRNLLMEKYAYMMASTHPGEYARMKDVLPVISPEQMAKIEEIVDINIDWQREAEEKYPNLRAKGRPLTTAEDTPFVTSFETYLRGELMTYSKETILVYHEYTLHCLEKQLNLAILNLQNMIVEYGYLSLEEANEKMK